MTRSSSAPAAERQPARERRERPRSWWIPYLFFVFFGVVIAVNGVMVYFATASWTGLQEDHHYLRGLAYNQAIAEQEAQDRLGWAADLTVAGIKDAVRPHGAALELSIRDAQGRPVPGLTVTGQLVRPTSEGLDVDFTLTLVAAGDYRAEVAAAKAGVYDVILTATGAAGTYKLKKRVQLD